MSYIVIFGSARDNGATRKTVDRVFQGREHRFVDLRTLNIAPFDYNYAKNENDDFLPLIREITNYDTIVLASPVYWYAVSCRMKTFLDRWSDLLAVHKELAYKLERKRLFLITSFGAEAPLGCVGFENPIRQSCQYMNIDYGGCFYNYPEDNYVKSIGFPSLEEFQTKLFTKGSLELKLSGPNLSLRLATMEDRSSLFEWMTLSENAPKEKQKLNYDAFKSMWEPFYFQQPLTSRGHVFVIEKEGEGIGGIAFRCIDAKNRSEVEVWMKYKDSHAYASEASDLLTRFLHRELGIAFFWMQRAQSEAKESYNQFRPIPLSGEDAKVEFGLQEHNDNVYMLRDMSLG